MAMVRGGEREGGKRNGLAIGEEGRQGKRDKEVSILCANENTASFSFRLDLV